MASISVSGEGGNASALPGAPDLSYTQESDLLQNLISDVHLAEALFDEDRIGEAFFLLRNIDQLVALLSDDSRSKAQNLMEKSAKIMELRMKGNETLKLLELIGTKEVWNEWNAGIGPNHDVTVSTHRDEQKGQCFMKFEGNLRCTMKEACAAILEHDLFPIWAPLCKQVHCLDSLSACRRVMQLSLELVMLKRKAVCDVHLDVLPDGAVLISLCPFQDSPQNLPDQRAELWGGILLRESEVEVEQLIELDASPSKPQRPPTRAAANVRSSLTPTSLADLFNGKAEISLPTLEVNPVHAEGDIAAEEGRRRSGYKTGIPAESQKHRPTASRGTSPRKSLSPRWAAEARTKAVKIRKRVIAASIVVNADLHLDFIPDWIFNLAIKSSSAMLLPMMEHQANLFAPGGLFHERLERSPAYTAIQDKLNEFKLRAQAV